MKLPEPRALKQLAANPDYTDGFWILIDIDVCKLDTKLVRLNIPLPQGLVSEIDDYAKAHGA